jgi:hypothetical protein
VAASRGGKSSRQAFATSSALKRSSSRRVGSTSGSPVPSPGQG